MVDVLSYVTDPVDDLLDLGLAITSEHLKHLQRKEFEDPTIEDPEEVGEASEHGGGELIDMNATGPNLNPTWPEENGRVPIPYCRGAQLKDESWYRFKQAADRTQIQCSKLEFKEVSNDQCQLEVIGDGVGCWAFVGFVYPHKNKIHLSTRCTTGNAQHEILHALGMHHEQVREDRDDYVSILWNNIDSSWKPNYEKTKKESTLDPYDLASMMHYPCGNAILPIGNPSLSFCGTMGQRLGMTTNDIAQLQRMYNCTSDPTPAPTNTEYPTPAPQPDPTSGPTPAPQPDPTPAPSTNYPTPAPQPEPTSGPTPAPQPDPTPAPSTNTEYPTPAPQQPSIPPTDAPTMMTPVPTSERSPQPTLQPTEPLSIQPTDTPTLATPAPTLSSPEPTLQLTPQPTKSHVDIQSGKTPYDFKYGLWSFSLEWDSAKGMPGEYAYHLIKTTSAQWCWNSWYGNSRPACINMRKTWPMSIGENYATVTMEEAIKNCDHPEYPCSEVRSSSGCLNKDRGDVKMTVYHKGYSSSFPWTIVKKFSLQSGAKCIKVVLDMKSGMVQSDTDPNSTCAGNCWSGR